MGDADVARTKGGDMELGYRIAVGILYFGQMAALIVGYSHTHDRRVLYHAERESRLMGSVRGVWAGLIMVLIALYTLVPVALQWGHIPLPHVVRWLGLLGGITAEFLILWTVLALGKNISATLHIHEAHRLVTEGPYRYVRHPLYSGGVLLFVSLALMASNWIIGVLGIGFQVLIIAIRTPEEERMLRDHFGESYQRYMDQAGALFPKIR
jgi:protein-S-isoprenylcysteine O-methyltransferase Ste14